MAVEEKAWWRGSKRLIPERPRDGVAPGWLVGDNGHAGAGVAGVRATWDWTLTCFRVPTLGVGASGSAMRSTQPRRSGRRGVPRCRTNSETSLVGYAGIPSFTTPVGDCQRTNSSWKVYVTARVSINTPICPFAAMAVLLDYAFATRGGLGGTPLSCASTAAV